MDYELVEKVDIQALPKILIEILENGDNTFDLDSEEGGYQQYFNIKLNN